MVRNDLRFIASGMGREHRSYPARRSEASGGDGEPVPRSFLRHRELNPVIAQKNRSQDLETPCLRRRFCRGQPYSPIDHGGRSKHQGWKSVGHLERIIWTWLDAPRGKPFCHRPQSYKLTGKEAWAEPQHCSKAYAVMHCHSGLSRLRWSTKMAGSGSSPIKEPLASRSRITKAPAPMQRSCVGISTLPPKSQFAPLSGDRYTFSKSASSIVLARMRSL